LLDSYSESAAEVMTDRQASEMFRHEDLMKEKFRCDVSME